MRATPERQARIEELGRRIGSDSTATIIDHALGIALAHTPKKEATMVEKSADNKRKELAEEIYSESYPRVDDRAHRRETIERIEDWLRAGDDGEGVTARELSIEWDEYDEPAE